MSTDSAFQAWCRTPLGAIAAACLAHTLFSEGVTWYRVCRPPITLPPHCPGHGLWSIKTKLNKTPNLELTLTLESPTVFPVTASCWWVATPAHHPPPAAGPSFPDLGTLAPRCTLLTLSSVLLGLHDAPTPVPLCQVALRSPLGPLGLSPTPSSLHPCLPLTTWQPPQHCPSSQRCPLIRLSLL